MRASSPWHAADQPDAWHTHLQAGAVQLAQQLHRRAEAFLVARHDEQAVA
jgi:hypothetical protein